VVAPAEDVKNGVLFLLVGSTGGRAWVRYGCVYIINRSFVVGVSPEGGADRVVVVAPAEDTLVGAGERGRRLRVRGKVRLR